MRDVIILFDLGGVLIDWDPRYLYRKMFAGDEAAMELFLADVCTGEWNLELDRGRTFAEAVPPLIAQYPEHRQFIEAYRDRWIEMIAGTIGPTVDILNDLKAKDRRLAALTNWSAETLPLVRHDPAYSFFDDFEQIFVSGEIGLIKPDPAIFRHATDALGLPPQQIYFIDDNINNVQAASELGMQACHFIDAASLRQWLVQFELLDG